MPSKLEEEGEPRFRAHTEYLVGALSDSILWESFGIVGDVIVSLLSVTVVA